MSAPETLRRRAVGVFLALLGLFALTNSGVLNAVDAWPALSEAASLVERGNVRYRDLAAEKFAPEAERALRGAPVAKTGIALNLAYVPLYVAAKCVAAVSGAQPMSVAKGMFGFVNAVAGAAIGAAVFWCLRTIGFAAATAGLATIATTLGTYLWPLTSVSYSDPLQVAFVTAVLCQALRARRSGTWRDVHLLGALCVVATLAKYVNAPAALCMTVPAMERPETRRRVLVASAGWAAALVAAFAAVNFARFGAPFSTGYPAEQMSAFSPVDGPRLLFLSFSRGLVWFMPLLPFAFAGLVMFVRRMPWIGGPIVAALAAHLLVYLCFAYRDGGNCLGPRYLLLYAPLCAFGLAEAVERGPSVLKRLWPWMTAACVAWLLPTVLLPWFLLPPIGFEVAKAGGRMRDEPVPLTFHRLLLETSVVGDRPIPLAAFSAVPVAGTVEFKEHDNGGWQAWWIKPHPKMPTALRWSGAACLAALSLLGLRLARDRRAA